MATRLISCIEAKEFGLVRYFTGRPCPRGHIAERYVSARKCVVCGGEDHANFMKAHPEINRALHKRWRTRHPQKHIDNARDWQKANPALARRYKDKNSAMRRAQMHGSPGTYTPEDVADIAHAQRNKCAYCRADFQKVKRHTDHIVALSRGGSNDRRNIQLLCSSCNFRKNAKDPLDFARELGRLC